MSTVAQDVQQIREAIYGREVREAIADGIEHCYSDVSGGVTTANTAAAAADAAAQRANTAAAGAEGIPGTASLGDVTVLKNALIIPVTWRTGYYIESNGAYISFSPFNASEMIPLYDASGITKLNLSIRVKLNKAAYIAYYDKNRTFISSETTSDSSDVVYETNTSKVPAAYYVAVSNMKEYSPTIVGSFVETDVGYVTNFMPQKNLFDPYDPRIQIGKFVNYNGIISLEGFAVSHPIPIQGGVAYSFDQPNSEIGNSTQYAVCDPYGKIIEYRTDIPIVDNVMTITEPESCYVLVNIHTTKPGIDKFRFCQASIFGTEKYVYTGKLTGKRILYNGDSITEGRFSGFAANGGAYPGMIAKITGGTYQNRAVGGGTLAVHGTSHNICTDVANMDDNGDIICLEGGINDYWGNVPLGTYSESDFTGEVDNTTICGALEYMFRQAINKWIGKPIVFVIVHKITTTAWNNNTAGYCFADVREKMIGICHKYSIPYLDMWAEGGLNAYMSTLDNAFLNGGASVHPDGCHPDANGYKKYYVPRLIALFESVLPYDD